MPESHSARGEPAGDASRRFCCPKRDEWGPRELRDQLIGGSTKGNRGLHVRRRQGWTARDQQKGERGDEQKGGLDPPKTDS